MLNTPIECTHDWIQGEGLFTNPCYLCQYYPALLTNSNVIYVEKKYVVIIYKESLTLNTQE